MNARQGAADVEGVVKQIGGVGGVGGVSSSPPVARSVVDGTSNRCLECSTGTT
jgi:hypothetical protein